METNDINYDKNGKEINPLMCDACGVVSNDVKSDAFGDYCDDCRAVETGY